MSRRLLVGLDKGPSRINEVAFDLTCQQLAEAGLPTPWCLLSAESDVGPVELALTATEVLALLTTAPMKLMNLVRLVQRFSRASPRVQLVGLGRPSGQLARGLDRTHQ
ncbi:MAG: hypothetical protein O2943_08605 [Actinomycetota bacterium]|nr:hypothetical protein [Actinomycetota bacterium]